MLFCNNGILCVDRTVPFQHYFSKKIKRNIKVLTNVSVPNDQVTISISMDG